MSVNCLNYSLNKQAGVVTLVTAIVLMLAVFGISFYMSNAVISETRVAATQLRGIEAFNSAQSGIERLKSATGTIHIVSEAYPSSSVTFEVTADELSPGLVEVRSEGFSRDGTTARTITYYMAREPSDNTPPSVPIVAKGGVNTSGNISAVNNYSNLTVWNGLGTGIQGSASTYTSIDGIKNQLSTIKNTSGTATYGADVVTGDKNLADADADDIVNSFFGYTDLDEMVAAKSAASNDGVDLSSVSSGQSYCYVQSCDTAVVSFAGTGNFNLSSFANVIASQTDWAVDDYAYWSTQSGRSIGNLDDGFSGSHFGFSPGTEPDTLSLDSKYIGTPTKPVMIVVKGEVTIPSNTYVFGVVVAEKIRLQSNTSVFGGVVALSNEADAFQGAGGAVVFMDETLIKNAGNPDKFLPVKSGWKDW